MHKGENNVAYFTSDIYLTQHVQYVCRNGRAMSAHSSKRGIISGLKRTKFAATRNCRDARPYVLKHTSQPQTVK